ncbi:MAG: ABC transporter substrate-binding protein, partial [Chloroflexi bacterium]|nr:ABC transporter substrate-binding protein [Chloroflexota bacterium]
PETPKYGGIINLVQSGEITWWEDIVTRGATPGAVFRITNEAPWAGDWAKGPAGGYGSNETTWDGAFDKWANKAGYIAESWKFDIGAETSSVTWNIRKGVRWALNPNSEASRLVNGRELTADDVVFSLKQVITDSRAYIYRAQPELRVAKITAPDKYTVKIEVPSAIFQSAVSRFGDSLFIVPPEVVQKLGDMNDWKRSVGTGPFILTDFVPAGSATFVRNPNYWMKDPIGPGKGNQLPYLDGIKILMILDRSTLLAALRTGKIDVLSYGTTITLDDARTIKQTTPQLLSHTVLPSTSPRFINMRVDRAPFNDKRIRRALMMATDFEGIKNKYYAGEAQILSWPIVYNKEYGAAYLGLDDPEMPDSVKELYIYNPEKAKALLKEAGYPNGFKTKLTMRNTTEYVDYFSIIKDMWAKAGIELTLDPKELGARKAILGTRNYEMMFDGDSAPLSQLYTMVQMRGLGNNFSYIDDPVIEQDYARVQKAAGSLNFDEADRLHKELMKHVLDQAYTIPGVAPSTYYFWWPWLKNYNGEGAVGYFHRNYYNWVWLDQGLKKSMGF